MQQIDLRRSSRHEILGQLLAAYNKLQPGEEIVVTVPSYSAGLKMGLAEAGAKHQTERIEENCWRLVVRGAAPSLSSAPGIHHVVAGRNGDVWTCRRDRQAARIDGGALTLAATREVATKASHLALDEDRGRLFIADAGKNALLCVRSSDLATVEGWPIPGSPQLPLVTADGIACVTGGGAGVLGIIWPSGDAFRSKLVEVGNNPHDPAVSPDGRSILVPCAGDGEIVQVSLADGAVTGRFRVGDGPAHLAVHPNGTRIYVANTFDGTLACMSPEGDLLQRVTSGGWAHVPAVTPDGRLVYVANFLDDTVSVFDALTLERVATRETDAYPHGLDISPDGNSVAATGFSAGHVRIYDGATAAERARIQIGAGSSHTAFHCDGRRAFVGCSISDHLAAIDLASGQLLKTIRLN